MACTVLITTADGVVYRLGPDEPDAGWVPEGLQWSTSLPGGDKDCTFNLKRRIDEDIPLRLRDEVEVIDEDGDTRWSGRIAGLPRQHGTDYLVNVQCVGWAAHLNDDEAFTEIYVDRTLSHWTGLSTQRRIDVIAIGYAGTDGQVTRDPSGGAPALALEGSGPWTSTTKPTIEAWYDAGSGNRLGELFVAWKSAGINHADGNWVFVFFGATTAEGASTISTSDLAGVSPPSSTSLVLTTSKRYAMIQLAYATGPAGADNSRYAIYCTTVAAYGDHGLTKQGSTPNQGFYIDQMLAHALTASVPKLSWSTGDGGTIERPYFIVQQAEYREPTTVADVVQDLNKYVFWEWLVYNKTFYYRPSDPDRLCWEARLDEGALLNLEGDDDERTINGVIVTYSLPDGDRRVAGPPGSGFNVESAALSDPNPDNSATAHGYTRAWKKLDITFPSYDDAAVSIGSAYLAETSLPARSGDITLVGEIEHPTKGKRPVREIKSGDWIKLTDFPTDVPRRIIQTQNSEDGRSVTVTVGNDVKKVDALLEQLGVQASLL